MKSSMSGLGLLKDLNEFISSNTFYPSASDELLKIVSGTNVDDLHMRRKKTNKLKTCTYL